MPINLQFKGLDSTANLYAVLYSEDGEQVWNPAALQFVSYTDDPNGYGLTMTENAYRLGFYSVEVGGVLADGSYSYEVWEAEGSENDQTTDRLLAVETFSVKDGEEVQLGAAAEVSITGLSAFRDLERAVLRASNRAGRNRGA